LRNCASIAALCRWRRLPLANFFEQLEVEMAKAQSKSSGEAEDAGTLLMEDHRRVQKIFDRFKKLKDEDVEEKEDLLGMACSELRIHASLEEEIFYPALRDELADTDLVDEAEVEHTVAKQLIGELEEMTPEDELYDAKFKVLGEYVNHHVAEEEKQLIPQAKKAKVDMQALGKRIQQRKQELQQELGVVPGD
jgi:Hemerythrin HHE cation binding domain